MLNCEVRRIYTSGAGTQFSGRHHKIVECPWIESARIVTGRNDLFCCHYPRIGTYALCHWVIKPNTGQGPGYFIELDIFYGHPDKYLKENSKGNTPTMEYVRMRCHPVEDMMTQLDSQLMAESQAENQKEDDSNQHMKDTVKWLRGKSRPWAERVADGIASGDLGFSGGNERALKEIQEAMLGA